MPRHREARTPIGRTPDGEAERGCRALGTARPTWRAAERARVNPGWKVEVEMNSLCSPIRRAGSDGPLLMVGFTALEPTPDGR